MHQMNFKICHKKFQSKDDFFEWKTYPEKVSLDKKMGVTIKGESEEFLEAVEFLKTKMLLKNLASEDTSGFALALSC